MQYRPTFDEFRKLAHSHSVVPVYRRLIGDTLTPVSAFCKIQEGEWSFLFESVVGGERIGRYSFLGSGPFLRVEAFGTSVRLFSGTKSTPQREFVHPDPTAYLEELLRAYKGPHLPELPRFCGGAVGYAGYDTVRYVEHLPNAPPDDRNLPDLCFAFYDRMVIFDNITKTVLVVANAVDLQPKEDAALKQAYDRACLSADRLVERLQLGVADLQLTDIAPLGAVARRAISNLGEGGYAERVRRCQEYIRAGDIFQVVPSQRFQTTTTARPFDIYRALRVVNPSPFMFYLKCGNSFQLIGASPEIMTRVENGLVTVRPLAGTRRRGATPEEDDRLADELLADPKERAEHIMLVDLARNDVGRIAEFGSVRIPELLTIERYSHVMHISSTVTGKLLPSMTPFDALRSCLPAGTLSGAPKIRAMEIIDEMEPHRRGPYGGAIGYIDYSGNLDTCIALRTMVMLGQTVYIQAGAGIVADSDPDAEHQETVNKAAGLLRALEMAETQL